VQYLDVGLKVEVEPEIHLDGEVGIKVSLEVSNIAKEINNAASGSVAYQIGTRTASTVLRLKDGETQVLAGLLNNEDRKSGTGIAGISDMPILGRLFTNKSDTAQKTEIVLSITPRIVANVKLQEAGLIEYWTGTENSLRENPLTLRQTGTVALPTNGAGAPAAGAATGRPAPVPRGPSRVLPRPSAETQASTAAGPAQGAAAAASTDAPPALPVVVGVQAPAQAKVGDKFNMQFTAQFPQAASAIGFQLNYDPTALKVLDVAEGDLFRLRGLETNFSRDIDAGGGQVTVELSQKSGDPSPGAGAVASISFEVIAAKPQTTVTVTRVTPNAADGSALPFGMPAPHVMVLTP
jgi:general secretion pathway protein D